MDEFTQTLLSWQLFYTAVATAAATLTGLLFVSLSLNREKLKDEPSNLTLSIARNSFGDFLLVLMISLVFLVPHESPLGLIVSLSVLGIAGGVGMIVREARRYSAIKVSKQDIQWIVHRIALPSIASLGLIYVAIAIAFGNYRSIFVLVGVIAALLVSACWNAWLLLVEP
jgi:hypothetical protein